MFQHIKNKKGFTLVELMIVVAIIGILSAVAIPYYQRYVSKARIQQVVIPGLRAAMNSVTASFAAQDTNFGVAMTRTAGGMADFISKHMRDANTQCFTVLGWTTAPAFASFSVITDTLTAPATCRTLAKVEGGSARTIILTARPLGTEGLKWEYSGPLSEELGIR